MEWLLTLFWFPITVVAFALTVIFWATIIYLGYQVITESWDDFQQWRMRRNEPDLTIDDYVNAGVDGHETKVKNGSTNNIRRR
jgi:hypothetical protein